MGIFQDSKVFDSNRFKTGLVVCLIVLPVSIIVSVLFRNSTFDPSRLFHGENAQNPSALRSAGSSNNFSGLAISPCSEPDSRNVSSALAYQPDDKFSNGTSNPEVHRESSSTNDSSRSNNGIMRDRLFAPGFDDRSCLSRYEANLYRKPSTHKPSAYLISKLRRYEHLHRRCGPNTRSYEKSSKRLKTRHKSSLSACKYIVWLPANGLGNRMISMASTFLYALLTNRVLLIDHGVDMADLFCEPFANTSWLLPHNFPLKNHLKARYAQSFGRMVKNGIINESSVSYVYMNLDHSKYYDDKKLFYCDKTEALLENITWLMMLSDQYFAPYFFLNRSYRNEVTKMFPEKETVFHHLSSYLFSPTNQAWGLITRFYNAYLAKADQRVGLQIRVFNPTKTPLQTVLNQLLDCTLKERILPKAEIQNPEDPESEPEHKIKTSKAVLVTSLHYEFYANLSNMYWTKPTITGEVVGVYQPSHEEFQHFGDNMHNMKAWAEMYLLSLTDMLVTSSWSTFGYVAQALGGLKPWILFKTRGKNIPNPSCTQDLSMEPCFHFPPTYDCDAEVNIDAGTLLPYLRHCLDLKRGVKLLPHHDEQH